MINDIFKEYTDFKKILKDLKDLLNPKKFIDDGLTLIFPIIYILLFFISLGFVYQCGDPYCLTCTATKLLGLQETYEKKNIKLILTSISFVILFLSFFISWIISIKTVKSNLSLTVMLITIILGIWMLLFFSMNQQCGPIPLINYFKEEIWK